MLIDLSEPNLSLGAQIKYITSLERAVSSEVQGKLKATNSWDFLSDPNDSDTGCLASRLFGCLIYKQKASFLIIRIIFHLRLSPYNILVLMTQLKICLGEI